MMCLILIVPLLCNCRDSARPQPALNQLPQARWIWLREERREEKRRQQSKGVPFASPSVSVSPTYIPGSGSRLEAVVLLARWLRVQDRTSRETDRPSGKSGGGEGV